MGTVRGPAASLCIGVLVMVALGLAQLPAPPPVPRACADVKALPFTARTGGAAEHRSTVPPCR